MRLLLGKNDDLFRVRAQNAFFDDAHLFKKSQLNNLRVLGVDAINLYRSVILVLLTFLFQLKLSKQVDVVFKIKSQAIQSCLLQLPFMTPLLRMHIVALYNTNVAAVLNVIASQGEEEELRDLA